MTYRDMLDNFFLNDEIKMILSGQWGYIGLPPTQASTIGMCQMMINYLKDDAFFPVGGTQGFANAIFKKFIDFGGHIMLSCTADKIFCNAKDALGVKLQNGREIPGRLFVSNIDARQTFFKLLDGKLETSFTRSIGQMRESCSFSLLYFGIGKGADLRKLKRGFYHTATDASYRDDEWLYVSIPTSICPTLVPQDKQIISVVVYLAKEKYTDITNWKTFKESLIADTINRIEKYLPDIKKYIEVIEAATPKTLERYTLNTDGAAYRRRGRHRGE